MKFLRSKRLLATGGAVAAAAAVTLAVVLPALATAPGDPIPPASSSGVLPTDVATGGQNNDCSVFGSPASDSYRIANPKDGTYKTTAADGTKVTFTLDLNPPTATGLAAYSNDKYLSLTGSTGAAIADIGVKGGNDSARYNYLGHGGTVASDLNLHAPAQSTISSTNLTPTLLYSVSQITFCYSPAGSISGNVYQDNTVPANGAKDAGDPGLPGWTVRLYDHGAAIQTTTSTADGSYGFSLPLTVGDATYTVCEEPPSGTWAQSEPSPSGTTVCTHGLELPKGYVLPAPTSSSQSLAGNDFGNVPAVPCTQPFGTTDGTYRIKLASCKSNSFVFNSGTLGGKLFVSVWVGDHTLPEVPMVERITWPYDKTSGQNQIKVRYTDDFPFDTTKLTDMPYCLLDPRDPGAPSDPDLTLAAAYQDASSKGSVLPAGATSCLISTTVSVDGSGNGHFVAYVYSDIDGLRTSG